ncbi:hypothetical protein [Candidatus Deianiraea vastatrix]|uniref:Uncharacterized protein n=1 Tax=Candidatus Deianiraea vastatrix TaxID=2163644 RepID=A0A5B8XEK7_9RICK|nr:hypothetical protein [Candidatus Deianiraea vastatrix]QED23752.1 hypothetical protein Deia_00966 [Candidatus Deianiraea vastatrix]
MTNDKYIHEFIGDVARQYFEETNIKNSYKINLNDEPFLKIFNNLNIKTALLIQLISCGQLKMFRLIKKYLTLDVLMNVKVKNLSQNDKILINLYKLLISKKDYWILYIESDNIASTVGKKMYEIIISKAKTHGKIEIYTKYKVLNDMKDDDFEYLCVFL